MKLPPEDKNKEILRRRNLVLENHTLAKWVDKLTDILNSN
jgi:hypothetical protein